MTQETYKQELRRLANEAPVTDAPKFRCRHGASDAWNGMGTVCGGELGPVETNDLGSLFRRCTVCGSTNYYEVWSWPSKMAQREAQREKREVTP